MRFHAGGFSERLSGPPGRLRQDAAHALNELDSVDLEAIALSHAWGFDNGDSVRVPPSPCARTDCGELSPDLGRRAAMHPLRPDFMSS